MASGDAGLRLLDIAPPPAHLIDHADVATYLRSAGFNLATLFKHVALAPDARCLDLGCGTGRLALGLLPLLDASRGGHYHGIDIHPERIAWARTHLGGAHPAASFTFIDHRSPHFNPGGQPDASLAPLPLADGSFDAILAHSLFTHLLRPVALHLLAEVGRLLRPGGWFYMTGYLLDAESLANLDAGRAAPAFPVEDGELRYASAAAPEEAVAISLDCLETAARRHGWRPVFFQRGPWREGRPAGQDIAIWRAAGESGFAAA